MISDGGNQPQETFGAMARTERIFYILEQVRLCLERKDYIRCVSTLHGQPQLSGSHPTCFFKHIRL